MNPIQPQVPQQPIDNNQPVSQEQKQVLLDLIGQIRGKLKDLGAIKFAAGNKTELFRRNLLRQTFEKLQAAGVDLSSRESVAEFITKLQQENPELATMFEQFMGTLLGESDGGSFAPPQDPNTISSNGMSPQNNMNNINQNEISPENIPQG